MKIFKPTFLMVLLTVPVLSQDRQSLPDTPRHTLGLEYSSNYIGNMGSITYSYNFNSSISTYMNNAQGQIFVFFIMVVAAAEAAVGLGILVMIYRNTKSTDISLLDKLRH